jgi:hypothetical protein
VTGTWRPNPAALLLFGVSPQSWLPRAKAEFVRYAGQDIDSEVVARKTVTGTLADQLEGVWAQLSAHLASVPDHRAHLPPTLCNLLISLWQLHGYKCANPLILLDRRGKMGRENGGIVERYLPQYPMEAL